MTTYDTPDSEQRYLYFLRETADSGYCWTLMFDDHSYVEMDDGDDQYFHLLWSSRIDALKFVKGDWADAEVVRLSAVDLITKWMPRLVTEQMGLIISTMVNNTGYILEPYNLNRFKYAVLRELKRANNEFGPVQ